jgi:hypothetical protein
MNSHVKVLPSSDILTQAVNALETPCNWFGRGDRKRVGYVGEHDGVECLHALKSNSCTKGRGLASGAERLGIKQRRYGEGRSGR